jgi:hypothetical protein
MFAMEYRDPRFAELEVMIGVPVLGSFGGLIISASEVA